MTFEALLAKKYIFAQKRHSILTISSIAAALALMTLLFCGFSTAINCIIKSAPYHTLITNVTPEFADYVDSLDSVDHTERDKHGDLIDLRLFYSDKVTNLFQVKENMLNEGLGQPDKYHLDPEKTETTDNDLYLAISAIGDNSKMQLIIIFSIFYIFILFVAFALRLIIDTAFEVSSKEREKQFGVLQSAGASPRQIVGIITVEGLMLSLVGIPLGIIIGIALTFVAFNAIESSGFIETMVSDPKYLPEMGVDIVPMLLLICAVTGLVWVMLSAYGTGMRIIKKTPIQAITERSNNIMRVRRHSLWGLLFGWTGKMATRNNHRQPKRYIITILALTLSITLFASFSLVLNTADDVANKMFGMVGMDVSSWDPKASSTENTEALLKKLNDSGYFKNIRYRFTLMNVRSDRITAGDLMREGHLEYCNRKEFEQYLENISSIDVTYDDLVNSGGYLMLDYTGGIFPDGDHLDITLNVCTGITKEEFDEALKNDPKSVINPTTGFYRVNRDTPYTIPIAERIDVSELAHSTFIELNEVRGVTFLAPTETYDRSAALLGEHTWGTDFMLDYSDYSMHDQAVKLLEQVFSDGYYEDLYEVRHKLSLSIAALKTGTSFVSLLISAIALVNLINIISTGIANRKSELAAMQCLGMTPGQMYRMAFVESLQYVFCSAIAATGLCALMIFGLKKALSSILLESDLSKSEILSIVMVGYSKPLPAVLFASAVALIAALITSFIPLHIMQKESLVDQIRSIE